MGKTSHFRETCLPSVWVLTSDFIQRMNSKSLNQSESQRVSSRSQEKLFQDGNLTKSTIGKLTNFPKFLEMARPLRDTSYFQGLAQTLLLCSYRLCQCWGIHIPELTVVRPKPLHAARIAHSRLI